MPQLPFSGWAEIFAELAGRCLTLTPHLWQELFGVLHSHPRTAIAGSGSGRGIIQMPRGASRIPLCFIALRFLYSEDDDLQFPAGHLAKVKSQT